MNAQHIIAKLAGFNKWTELAKATETELQRSKLLFDNMHKVSAEEWVWCIFGTEIDNRMNFCLFGHAWKTKKAVKLSFTAF